MSARESGPAHILVVDDEPDMCEMMLTVLAQDGYEVVAAQDGHNALAAAQRVRFDLATIDLRMPGMGGRELLSELRSLDPDIQVLVISGYATPEESAECMALGALAVVGKPFDLDRLLTLVQQGLSRRYAASGPSRA
jgi:DNA-binding NtrC family response regulator